MFCSTLTYMIRFTSLYPRESTNFLYMYSEIFYMYCYSIIFIVEEFGTGKGI